MKKKFDFGSDWTLMQKTSRLKLEPNFFSKCRVADCDPHERN